MKRWQGGLALFFLAILFTHFLGEKPSVGTWIGMYVALMLPAGVGYAMATRNRPCALAESGAKHCDRISAD